MYVPDGPTTPPPPPSKGNGAVKTASKPTPKKAVPNLHVTLWPEFAHFARFARDPRVQGIRLNSAMMELAEINDDFTRACKAATVPLWFDVKAMQMRIRQIACNGKPVDAQSSNDIVSDHLEFFLNRPVKLKKLLPCPVWFKAGEDAALLVEIRNGNHFIFEGGPKYEVKVGESIHLRQDEDVGGPVVMDYEIEKIKKVMSMGFTRFYLSYVYDWEHVNKFREIVGKDAQVILKIENKRGIRWVQKEWNPQPNTQLAAARGDMFIEIDQPHQIMNATKAILNADPAAVVGSRMLLSCVNSAVPSCADLNELAWLYDTGFRNFLLCDELCLKDELLSRAMNVFEAFREDYCRLGCSNFS